MPMTAEQRAALRQQCALVLPGFRQISPAEEFGRMAQWCEERRIAHDVYGDGPVLAAFETKIAGLLGKEAAVVMPSGVMAQLAAVGIWCERMSLARFGMHPTSHLMLHEQEAYQALTGLHGVPVGHRLRPMLAGDLDRVPQPLACLLVELPIREAGGRLPEWEELAQLKQKAAERGVPLHMDGARLWESRAYFGRSHAEIAAGFCSVYVSLYKGVGGLAGAVLAGDADFVGEARLWRRRLGGTLPRLSPLVVSAEMRFDERLALMDACLDRARRLAETLGRLPGIRVNPLIPQTNMMHVYFDAEAELVLERRDRIAAEEGIWLVNQVNPAEVPGWSVTEIYVGDSLLTLEDGDLSAYFSRLVAPRP